MLSAKFLRVCGAPIQDLIYRNNHNLNVFLKSLSLLQINRKLLKINELLQGLMFAATELRNIKEAEEREEGPTEDLEAKILGSLRS